MIVALPIWQDRISPVLDVAKRLLIVEIEEGIEITRREESISAPSLSAKAHLISGEGLDMVICCAVSRPFESMLIATGLKVVSGICGSVDAVLAAVASGEELEDAFRMPGCRRRGRRRNQCGMASSGRGCKRSEH